MSLATIASRALDGLDAPAVQVEVHLANGLPSFTLVGLADTEVKESRERVRAALTNSGFAFPHNKRITVSLAPADLPKESGRFDLPIALGILAADGQLDLQRLARHEFAGELSLAGELRPVRGALALSLALRAQAAAACAGAAGGERARGGARPRARRAHGGPLARRGARDDAGRRAAPVADGGPARGDGRTARRRPARRQGPVGCETCAGDRRGRRPQSVDDRPARQRQVDARAAPARLVARDGRRRGIGQRRAARARCARLRRARLGPTAGARAAPHRERGRAGGRRFTAAAGRDLAGARRRVVSRRAARVRARQPRGAARTARMRPHHDLARGAAGGVSGALSAGGGDEPVPVRLARRTGRQPASVPLHTGSGVALPAEDLRAVARSHRHAGRGAGRGAVVDAGRRRWRCVGHGRGPCGRGARAPAATAGRRQRRTRAGADRHALRARCTRPRSLPRRRRASSDGPGAACIV